MRLPISVFLDSNQFIGSKYNFTANSPLGILKKMVDDNKIKAYTSEIVIHEVDKHIEEDTRKAVKKVSLLRSEISKLVSRELTSGTDFDYLYRDFNKDSIFDIHKAKFNSFLDEIRIEKLDSSGVDTQSLVSDYINLKPPFQSGEKKKYEFPDAIMSHKLKNTFGIDNPIIIVSNDKGFIKSFQDIPGITTLNDIREVFDFINKDEEALYSMIHQHTQTSEFIENFQALLEFEIKSRENMVNGLDCDRKGYCSGHQYDYSEITQASLTKLNLKTLNHIQENHFNMTILCNVEIEAYCSFDDYNEAIYDKEHGKYYNVESVNVIEKHIEDIECDLDVKMSMDRGKINLTIESIDFSLELDSYTLIDRKYYEPKVEGKYESELMDTIEDYHRHQ